MMRVDILVGGWYVCYRRWWVEPVESLGGWELGRLGSNVRGKRQADIIRGGQKVLDTVLIHLGSQRWYF
jgi:hypothetical protein